LYIKENGITASLMDMVKTIIRMEDISKELFITDCLMDMVDLLIPMDSTIKAK